MKNMYYASNYQKKADGATQLSDKIYLKVWDITWDNEGYFIVIKKEILRGNSYKFLYLIVELNMCKVQTDEIKRGIL